jgi:hypothetical protein
MTPSLLSVRLQNLIIHTIFGLALYYSYRLSSALT